MNEEKIKPATESPQMKAERVTTGPYKNL